MQDINEMLKATEQYMYDIDDLSLDITEELYSVYDEAAKIVTTNIKNMDPELRVELNDRQDRLVDRIIELLPSDKYKNFLNSNHGVYSPSRDYTPMWTNASLMQAFGLAGYMLAKEIGLIPVMYFGSKDIDYSYLSILPEIEMIYFEPKSTDDLSKAYVEYILENYKKIDVLVLHGMYSNALAYVKLYKKFRPDGKVYTSLDMNVGWMNRITWDDEEHKNYAKNNDIISDGNRLIRDELNRNPNVHFSCRWISSGFYNPTKIQIVANPEKKENIILTVGRIGTTQKNNEELMIAFDYVANILSDWSLRFVGTIEPEFQKYIDYFFTERPDLKSRIIFTGPIIDKKKLYEEYSKAKVFVLTSLHEGSPNVIAEALVHGCMFVTSDIDIADDITNFNTLGKKYTRLNKEELAHALIEVCTKADEKGMKKHIPKALDYADRYYDWEKNAKKLAYMLFR
ncbi:MAG: glycosyltransferase [Oscillospiraceae bacterium]|nr:glycosyltransferase [Oscillospiraceae bacterium]